MPTKPSPKPKYEPTTDYDQTLLAMCVGASTRLKKEWADADLIPMTDDQSEVIMTGIAAAVINTARLVSKMAMDGVVDMEALHQACTKASGHEAAWESPAKESIPMKGNYEHGKN